MRRVLAVLALAAIPVLVTPTAAALGFGRTGNTSVLGQPLDFSAVLLLDPGETLAAECVAAEVLAGEHRLAPAKLRLRVDGAPRGPRISVHVRTTVRIVEPVVTVQLSAGCGAKLSRSFVAFIEPARRGRDVPVAVAAVTPAVETAPATPAPIVATPPPPAAAGEALQHERDRVAALEEAWNRARAEHAAAQQNVAALELRLREAEAARRNPPLVYGLATLVVLLLAAIGVLLWHLLRLRPQPVLEAASSGSAAHAAEHPLSLKETELDHTWTQMRVMTKPPISRPSPLETTQPPPITTLPAAHSTTRELGVDEVLDLEQQADFLIALAQDEAAIDLLMAHLRSSGGASAMPYLKLLDIYRRRADADAHERIRQRFSRRFNAHAPAIGADSAAGKSLADYPQTISRLQAAWASPEAAVALLESLMVRSHADEPGFDLPAFAELMLLHAIARDLRERETGEGGVDLLLPLAGETRVISAAAAPSFKLDLQLP